jgi:2-polyprenyl-3-methyl-5-hydroxy-6-metoxy-1,4-benzoquinol methylase
MNRRKVLAPHHCINIHPRDDVTTTRTDDDRVRESAVFTEATRVLSDDANHSLIATALAKWNAQTKDDAKRIHDAIASEFPDEFDPQTYWTAAAAHKFRDFFAWGHDHDFGFGFKRSGAMGQRHIEIVSECLQYGLMPADLAGRAVLDVGCWSGGDVLLLAGLGAKVTAIEEHRRSAASATRLCELVQCPINLVTDSVYKDRQDWASRYDVIYASGVIYHVTDPLLFARILFAYLKPGGTLILETKASAGDKSFCGYSGTIERGWNWYAPNREALGRWLVDAGFDTERIKLRVRTNGRLLSSAVKTQARALPETAGFSRPGSWLEGTV